MTYIRAISIYICTLAPQVRCVHSMFSIFVALFTAVVALQSYDVALKNSHNGDVVDFGRVFSEKNGVFEFKPTVQESEIPPVGCLGVREGSDFKCHTLYTFKNVPENSEPGEGKALQAFVGPDGELFHFQFTSGKLPEIFIETAQTVPGVVVPADFAPKKPKMSNDKLKDKWSERKGQSTDQSEPENDEDTDEEEPGFLRKYWIYIVPAALVILSNALKPPQPQ